MKFMSPHHRARFRESNDLLRAAQRLYIRSRDRHMPGLQIWGCHFCWKAQKKDICPSLPEQLWWAAVLSPSSEHPSHWNRAVQVPPLSLPELFWFRGGKEDLHSLSLPRFSCAPWKSEKMQSEYKWQGTDSVERYPDSSRGVGVGKGGYLVLEMLFLFVNSFLSEWQNFRNEKNCFLHTLDPSEHGQARWSEKLYHLQGQALLTAGCWALEMPWCSWAAKSGWWVPQDSSHSWMSSLQHQRRGQEKANFMY